MNLEDFISEFNSLYICCIFEKDWKKFDPINDEWKKNINSFGRPEKTNDAQKNYQIGITIHKQSTLFVSLRQKNVTALEGENFISIRVQKNEGRRLKASDVNSQNLCGMAPKLTNAATLSQQIILSADEYPYTFTIYIYGQRPNEKQNKSDAG